MHFVFSFAHVLVWFQVFQFTVGVGHCEVLIKKDSRNEAQQKLRIHECTVHKFN